MDTLKAVSAHPSQGSGLVQAPPQNDGQAGGPVSAVATTTTAVIPAKLPEQKDHENNQQITNAIKEINSFFQTAQRSLGFYMDEASGRMVMQIKDTETNELIRQIPGEDVLKLAERLDDLTGILFKAQA